MSNDTEERQPDEVLREKAQAHRRTNQTGQDVYYYWTDERVAAFAQSILAEASQQIEELKVSLDASIEAQDMWKKVAEAANQDAEELQAKLEALEPK